MIKRRKARRKDRTNYTVVFGGSRRKMRSGERGREGNKKKGGGAGWMAREREGERAGGIVVRWVVTRVSVRCEGRMGFRSMADWHAMLHTLAACTAIWQCCIDR